MRNVWKAFLLTFALVLGGTVPAWAVVSGDVQVEGGEALALDGATVQFQDRDGNIVAATSLDANGRGRVTFRDEDEDRTVFVVFFPRGSQDGTRLGTMKVPRRDFGTIVADLDMRQVSITGRPVGGGDVAGGPGLFGGPPTIILNLYGGYGWNDADISQTNTIGGASPPVISGSDDLNAPVIGAEVRVYPRNLLPGLFIWVGGNYNDGDFDVILGDLHPGTPDGVADIAVSGSAMWTGMGGLGFTVSTDGLGPCSFTQWSCFDASGYVGAGFTTGELNIVIDETSGGGVASYISEGFTAFSYGAGGSITFPLCPGCSWPIRGEVGVMAVWTDDMTVNARTSPFGFDYSTHAEFGPMVTGFVGIKIPFATD